MKKKRGGEKEEKRRGGGGRKEAGSGEAREDIVSMPAAAYDTVLRLRRASSWSHCHFVDCWTQYGTCLAVAGSANVRVGTMR